MRLIRWHRCRRPRARIASRWGRVPVRRCRACAQLPPGTRKTRGRCAPMCTASACTPGCVVARISARNSNACAATLRAAIAKERLGCDDAGNVVLQLKSPWREGTTHISMSPLEFMQRRAARDDRARAGAQRRRVRDCLEHCPQRGGEFKTSAAIGEPAVIVRILTHLGLPACPRAVVLTGAAAACFPSSLICLIRQARTVWQQCRRCRAACACAWRSACVQIGLDGSTQRPINPIERGVFTKHRANGSLIASRSGGTDSAWRKRGFEFPIH
jgi:hypothetical protein